MSETSQPKTQHDFNLAIVEAFRTTQGQIAELQARAASLEESDQKRALVVGVDDVSAALTALADAMPTPVVPADQVEEPQQQAA